MAIMKNLALFALLAAVEARPGTGHGNGHNIFHGPHTAGTGLPGPFSHHHGPPKATGTAPFPAGNGTLGGATGSTGAASSTGNGGPVYITSTIDVIPTPSTTSVYDSAGASGAGGAGNSGAGNSNGNSPAPATGGSPGGNGGNGGNAAGSACGPPTVTVTNANTVTVTVTPAGASSPANSGAANSGPANSGPNGPAQPSIPSSVYVPSVSSAPFPLGNSTVPAGTGSGTGVPTYAAAAETTTSSVAAVPTTSVPAAQPYQPAAEKYKPHQGSYPPGPAASSPAAESPAAQSPAAQSPAAQSPAAPASSSAPAPSSSSTSSSGPKSGKKGVAVTYSSVSQLGAVPDASWSCNWANSPSGMPLPGEFVPQLWGPTLGRPGQILGASASSDASNVLFYNEPDQPLEAGGCDTGVEQTISDWTTYMKPVQQAGRKVSTPCVSNGATQYMETFLAAFPSGTMDIMCFHWYGRSSVSDLQKVVKSFQSLATKYGVKEMWIPEMAVNSGPCGDLSPITSYLNGAVDRYAYNMQDMSGCTGY